MIAYWKKHFLRCELCLSVVIMAMLLLLNYRWLPNSIVGLFIGVRATFYGTTACVAGALLGFVITSLSILVAAHRSEAINALMKSKWYSQIHETIVSATRWLAIATIVAIIALVVDKDSSPNDYMLWVLIWCVLISSLRLFRTIWILENIVKLSGVGTKEGK